MEGNKELKEALLGLLALTQVFAKLAKDGLNLADVPALLMELQKPELVAKLVAAQEGYQKIPAEVKDLNLVEALDLVMAAAPEIMAIAGELKK